jgi:hypothetical protein
MALATVLGFSNTRPRTMGAAPSAWAPTMRGSTPDRPHAWYSLNPFQ